MQYIVKVESKELDFLMYVKDVFTQVLCISIH